MDAREPATLTDRLAFGALSLLLQTIRVLEVLRIRLTGGMPERN